MTPLGFKLYNGDSAKDRKWSILYSFLIRSQHAKRVLNVYMRKAKFQASLRKITFAGINV